MDKDWGSILMCTRSKQVPKIIHLKINYNHFFKDGNQVKPNKICKVSQLIKSNTDIMSQFSYPNHQSQALKLFVNL